MYKGIWSNIARKLLRAYAGLPRRGISIRASCQIFGTNQEVEESIDEIWGSVVQQFDQYDPWNWIDHEALRRALCLASRNISYADITSRHPEAVWLSIVFTLCEGNSIGSKPYNPSVPQYCLSCCTAYKYQLRAMLATGQNQAPQCRGADR